MSRIRLTALFLLVALLLGLSSCSDDDAIPPTEYYPHHCELALPLPYTYAEMKSDTFDAAFTDGVAVVGMIRISFSASVAGGIPTTLSPRQYAEYYMLLSRRECEIVTEGDVPYYTYEENGYFYTMTFYRSQYAYFTVMYSCASEKREAYESNFIKYATGAYFTA